jgi:sugar lactone lactonase YvrE
MSDQRCIWQYSFATDIISVIAGTNSNGFSGDNGPASLAQLSITQGLWLATSGVLYLADKGNNRIRMISTGIISTVAGSSGASFSGDNGPATAAYLSAPYSVYVSSVGKIFIADFGNNRVRVVDTNNIITTFAGNGQTTFNGDNIPAVSAELNYPVDVKGDRLGNIFVALYGHFRIRIIDNSGIISTLIGNGNSGFTSGLTLASTSSIHAHNPSGWIVNQIFILVM